MSQTTSQIGMGHYSGFQTRGNNTEGTVRAHDRGTDRQTGIRTCSSRRRDRRSSVR